MLSEILERYRYWKTCDRIGPDIPGTHWRLHFPNKMAKLCRSKFMSFGEQAEFRPGAYAITCSKISIGDRVVIRANSMLFAEPEGEPGKIFIEADVLIGAGVQIHTIHHAFGAEDRPIIDQGYQDAKDVVIRKGAWIGANSIIMPGVEIGRNAVIGAGSIVTRSVPAMAVAAGNPARVIRMQAS